MTDKSQSMEQYFAALDAGVKRCYAAAEQARSQGFDPVTTVSIPLAKNMAERVEGLVSVAAPALKNSGLSQRIITLEQIHGTQNWKIAFLVSLEVSQQKFCTFQDQREAMEVGMRVGLAYITNGVVSSPLEGFIRLEVKKRKDGQDYLCLYFGGPIRSAGTTATCIFVAVCDYVRLNMGYKSYDPTEDEIKRTYSEMEYYHERVTNLQYFPSEQEAAFLTRHLPLQIDGDPSEKIEAPNYKDLPRVSTNFLRNGFCLVMAEGLSQKFSKFWGKFSKWYQEIGMSHWVFLEDFVKLQKDIKSKGAAKKDTALKILPDYTYIKDLVAGRPILGHPLRAGAFRLRYGRTRTSGFSSDALHPATMHILDNYIAIGTQLKSERPGKATVISSCDTIEGPIVKLKDGSVVLVEDIETAKKINKDVEEILFAGDILINYGDFLNRGHVLAPAGYCNEWWALEFEQALGTNTTLYEHLLKNPATTFVSCQEAVTLSKTYNIPLHPRYTYHWADLTKEHLAALATWLDHAVTKPNKIIIPFTSFSKKEPINDPKRALELLGLPHKFVTNEYVVIEEDWAQALRASLGFLTKAYSLKNLLQKLEQDKPLLDILNEISEVPLRDKSGLYIGTRMGRPEKAKMRKLTGTPHSLFPVGTEGGRLRSFQSALKAGTVTADFALFYCAQCQRREIGRTCIICNQPTQPHYHCKTCGIINKQCAHDPLTYANIAFDINEYYNATLKRLGLRNAPPLVKGVRGVSNKDHYPEPLAKGILRAAHNIYVNKDGTTRYDMTEMAITHFKPKEIGTSIEQLKELGYITDCYGNELTNQEQILELKCQDLILPACPDSQDEPADQVLLNVANFVDDLLEKFYHQPRFYNLKAKQDLVGHLVIGLSPHTAAGIVSRIIGFSKTQGMFAHPLLHSIMRRDVDGDEAGVMLLMDAFLNFSRELLSNHRGATQDEPLVLTSHLVPTEVDDMVFDMDTVFKYPLELYEAAESYKPASEVKIETLKSRLKTPAQYEGYGFTHHTNDINAGVRCSSYKTIPNMEGKVLGQMRLAEKLRAVDTADVARLVIERHFIRDIKGNLRKFSMQEFRCVDCNKKYRRPPLKSICLECSGKLLFTISEGSVIKYLEPCISLAEKYELPAYLKQTLELTKQRIELYFGKEKDRQEGLGKWFG
ncbi:MAG TPA: DNA polymerase II large subunit [Candidatus Nanoarchaeia archaeon]|nr:DNA polymerase II large subunit [Candidatus Nanoarchaeia archaeon]